MNPSIPVNPGILTADGLVGIVFLIMLAVTITGGIIACCSQRLVRAVAGLIVCFVGVAAIYYFLNSPFVAMMQILIYVGAVCITISFAIMLAPPEEKNKPTGPSTTLNGPMGFTLGGLIFGAFTVLALRTQWVPIAKTGNGSIEDIGVKLLTSYSMVFELVSIVLLIAILGAIVIARQGRSK